MTSRVFIFAFILAATVPALAGPAAELEGVRFSETEKIDGTRLSLRGTALLRYMVFIKAYVGSLYLPKGVPSEDIFSPVAKRLELSYFHEIKAGDFAGATRKKIADNVSGEDLDRLEPRIDKLASLYRDVRPGDRYALTFLPGKGTELSLNGNSLGWIEGDDFARAVFSIWLGKDPIDTGFRDRLLGGS